MKSASAPTLLRHYPLSLLLAVVVIVLSLFPFGRIELAEQVPLADKWTHMVMYAALSFVICWEDLRCRGYGGWWRLLCLGLLLPAALGGLMELAQAYCTDYRSGEWLDLVADAIGAAVATVIVLLAALGKRKVGSEK